MKLAERIVILSLIVIIFGGSYAIYYVMETEKKSVREAVARGEYEIRSEENTSNAGNSGIKAEGTEDWRRYYPQLVPMLIGSTTVFASVADTLPDRIKGLSGTPYLPEGVVKLFAFGTEGEHSIWMKDMNYSLDILWVTKAGEIVHIEENVSPETYPKSFASPVPSWYVIEANAGFVKREGIELGDQAIVVVQ